MKLWPKKSALSPTPIYGDDEYGKNIISKVRDQINLVYMQNSDVEEDYLVHLKMAKIA